MRAYGPIEQPVPSSLCSRTQFGWMTVSAPMVTSRSTTFGPDAHAVAEVTLPSSSTFASMNTSRPTRDLAAHVDARGIGQRGAGEHELARALGAMQRFELGELHLVVDAEHFGDAAARSAA